MYTNITKCDVCVLNQAPASLKSIYRMNSNRYFVIYTKPVLILLRWTMYLLYCKLHIFKLKLEFVFNILGSSEIKIDQMYKRQKFLKIFSNLKKVIENLLKSFNIFAKLSQILIFFQFLNNFFSNFLNIFSNFLKTFSKYFEIFWELIKKF